MKILTHNEEFDIRYRNAICVLERHSVDSGIWECSDLNVCSTSSENNSKINQDKLSFKKRIDEVKTSVDYIRATIIYNEKIIINDEVEVSKTETERIYIEIIKDGYKFTTLLTSLDLFNDWLIQTLNFLKYPLVEDNFSADIMVLSPEVFGFLLHEGLGHRLENDDFSETIKWDKFNETNYDVFDYPGESSMYGHTPVGDDGRKGVMVKLFCGKTGETNLLRAETGNLRMVNYHHYPIIRQRCLLTLTHYEICPPEDKIIIYVDRIEKGIFDGNKIRLITSMQTLANHKEIVRLPNLDLVFNINQIFHFKAFDKNVVTELGSGCAKGMQRQLPITFNSSSSWIDLNSETNNVGIFLCAE